MYFLDKHFSKRQALNVIFAVTLGNFLEWYEIYLYVYWAPIISKLFFNNPYELNNLTHTFLIFGIGFLARPFGGIAFGRLGDRIGRRKALILSIVMMIIPTFITGLLPTYATVGFWAPYLLMIVRFLQAFPAGGELPGAFCYLYESAPWTARHYLCSWAVLGYQVGILVSTIECFLLERYLSPEDLITWGWRASFMVGGLLGMVGLLLRYRLHETTLFREELSHGPLVRTPILHVLYKNRVGIIKGILFCAFNSSAFYFFTINFPTYFGEILGIDYKNNLLITFCLLILITIPIPLFGKLADHYSNKKMLISAIFGMLLLFYPLYLALENAAILSIAVIMILLSLFYTCTSALIPYIVSDLFSTHDRFTCTAVSFNLADAILGGFTPVAVFYLLHFTKHRASFVWVLLFTALLSLAGYFYLKPRRQQIS